MVLKFSSKYDGMVYQRLANCSLKVKVKGGGVRRHYMTKESRQLRSYLIAIKLQNDIGRETEKDFLKNSRLKELNWHERK
ncbi:hypothetical protein BOTCAL_0408g00050 [Botryotinia calthae]|uniref:Uncharacterized protein n=1 Tax=Botryotinia calthae TaxID=38488 RepID=A0A4Y8CQR8_9HELO|nr:hypothetical protein BOTCAL_0408g00050 [Botryotinia calthae]